MVKVVFTTGKRKRAVARARLTPGKGQIVINSTPLSLWANETLRMWVSEPLTLAGELAGQVDIRINSKGGGVTGQAEAIRTAIARALVAFSQSEELKARYLAYDRSLLVYDPRRTEPHKPSRSKKGARRHKQRSKR
jgi:small subunit ribosomal protein S9